MNKEISWSAVAIVFLGFAWQLGLGQLVRRFDSASARREFAAQLTEPDQTFGFVTSGNFDENLVVIDMDANDPAHCEGILDSWTYGAKPVLTASLLAEGFTSVSVCGQSRRIAQ